MKRKIFFKVTITVLLISTVLFLFTACGNKKSEEPDQTSSNQTGKVYELNLNVVASSVAPFTTQVAEPWAEMVEKETNGVVKVNVFPGGSLGKLPTALQDIKNGVYEAGLVPPGRNEETEIFPLTIGDIPFLIESPEIAEKVLTQFTNKFLQEVFVDGTFLSISSTDGYQIYSNKPIRTTADIKNMKIADAGSIERILLLQELGAVPVSLDATALYESVEKGIVDGVMYTAVGANGYRFHEVTSYLNKLNLGGNNLMFMINTEFLNSLPEDIYKMFIEKFGPEYARLMTELYLNDSEEAIAIFEEEVKAKGGEVITPSKEELIAFKAPVKKLMEAWVEKANKKGYPGQEMMDYYTGLLKEQGAIIPE